MVNHLGQSSVGTGTKNRETGSHLGFLNSQTAWPHGNSANLIRLVQI